MVARGLVLRKRSKDDRRLYVLELSAAGKRVQERIEAARRSLAKRVVAALDERDLRDFERVAKKILAAAPFASAAGVSSRGEDRPARRASRARGRRAPRSRR
jgi:ribosomal protein L12E/L44/L45/RPP1/RPP2